MELYDLSEGNELDTFMSREVPVPKGDEAQGFWTQCKSRFYLRPLQFLTPDPFPISGYRECTKT